MNETGYELRPCPAAPAELGFEAGQGLLYLGPHGPCYADADGGSLRVRGAVKIEVGAPMLEARGVLAAGGLGLTADGRRLLMRLADGGRRRGGKAIEVLDGDAPLLVFRKGKRGAVAIERGDRTQVGDLPKLPAGTGSLAASAAPLEVGLLVAFAASMLASALDSTRAPYGLFVAGW
jgi:hypothetical protein